MSASNSKSPVPDSDRSRKVRLRHQPHPATCDRDGGRAADPESPTFFCARIDNAVPQPYGSEKRVPHNEPELVKRCLDVRYPHLPAGKGFPYVSHHEALQPALSRTVREG
jgi:hypothetical protein